MKGPIIQDAKAWQEKWNTLKAQGIDGFVVGVPPGKHPGPVTFDVTCSICNQIVAENTHDIYRLYKEHLLTKHL